MSSLNLAYQSGQTRSLSPASVVAVLLAHAFVLASLVALEVVPVPREMSALLVQVVTPSVLPEPVKTRERPTQRSSMRPASDRPPVVATSSEAAPVVLPTTQATNSIPTPASEPAVSQPRFDAAYLDNPVPVYPPVSRRLGEQGKVSLRVFVEADGRPGRIEIKVGSGFARLDQAAEQAVRRWLFIPAKRGDEAVAAWVVVPITFNLRD